MEQKIEIENGNATWVLVETFDELELKNFKIKE